MGKELPKNWVEVNLFEIANVITGKKDANHSTEDGEYTFFTCAFEPLKSPDYDFEDEVLILPGNGANVGHVFYFNGKFQAYQRTYIIEKIKINSKYLFYHLSAFWRIRNENEQFGTATNYIKIGNFKSYNLFLPPLAEQNRIVDKLDRLFAQVETIKTSMAKVPLLLKDFRQQVLTQAVTGKLTEEWRKGKELEKLTLIELSHFCKDSFYGPRFSKDDYTSEGFPTVRTTDMSDDGTIILSDNIPRIKIDDPKKIELYKVKKGDLLITRTGSIGKMARYFGEEIVIPSAYLIRFRFNELAITDYIYYCLISPYGQNQMGLNSVAVTQPNLNAQKIKTIKIPNINLEEQQEIISQIESLFAKADAIEQQYKTLKAKIDTLPQAILHKAFKGELSEQLESDGDARELLQQIQELKKIAVKPKKAKNYPENKGVLGMVAEK